MARIAPGPPRSDYVPTATAGGDAAAGRERYVYERRRPELGTLHRVVRENLQTLYAAIEQGFAAPLPAFVRRELEDYLDCGLLCRGFAPLACARGVTGAMTLPPTPEADRL